MSAANIREADQPLPIVVTDAGAEAHQLCLLLREVVTVLSKPMDAPDLHTDLTERIHSALDGKRGGSFRLKVTTIG